MVSHTIVTDSTLSAWFWPSSLHMVCGELPRGRWRLVSYKSTQMSPCQLSCLWIQTTADYESLSSNRQHLSYDGCLEVREKIRLIRTVLCCTVYWSCAGLLELKVTCVFMASVPFTTVSRLRATPVVMGSLATVPPGDRFLSPVPDGEEVMSEAREVCFFIGWNFFSLNVLSVWIPGHNSVPGNVTMFF